MLKEELIGRLYSKEAFLMRCPHQSVFLVRILYFIGVLRMASLT